MATMTKQSGIGYLTMRHLYGGPPFTPYRSVRSTAEGTSYCTVRNVRQRSLAC